LKLHERRAISRGAFFVFLVETDQSRMSTLHSTSNQGFSTSSIRSASATSWLREPLLHFVLLGALLFGLDHLLLEPESDGHLIVVGPEVDAEAVATFERIRGRKPNVEELNALHRIWLDNEVLYREGLAMQVDKGDPAIRERVIFKALSVIDANVKLPPIDEAELKKWFEARHSKYDEPARYDFQEAAISGDHSEAAVRDFVKALNNGTPGDAQAGLRVFKDRPIANLVQAYGADFPKQLEAATVGQWQPIQTRDGWRAIHVDAVKAPVAADFDKLRPVIYQDWKDATASEQRSAAVAEWARKYRIEYPAVAP
jgi:hypothetical protein